MIFICYNIDPTSHRTTFNHAKAKFCEPFSLGLKIDLVKNIYNLIFELRTQADCLYTLIFPSLINGICSAFGKRLLLREQPVGTSVSIDHKIVEASWQSMKQHKKR